MSQPDSNIGAATSDTLNLAPTEFPRDLLPMLRCSRDGGSLTLVSEALAGVVGVIDGGLRCETCGAEYRIERGIARLMIGVMTEEDRHEMELRDKEDFYQQFGPFVPPEWGWRSELMDRIEIPPHLEALAPIKDRLILEMGCGDGRFTLTMASMGARVLAVDFSIGALRQAARWLGSGWAPTTYKAPGTVVGTDLRSRVGLVHADINHLFVRHGFDRALSATPLDSRDQRMAMYRMIADALRDDGCFVGSVEHDDLTRRLLGLPIARRYSKKGIFIEHFSRERMRRETAPYFEELVFVPIRPRVPLAGRLPLRWGVKLARLVGALPLLRNLGEILLVRARHPARAPGEGQYRPGNRMAIGLLRWHMKRLGKPPVWGTDEALGSPSPAKALGQLPANSPRQTL